MAQLDVPMILSAVEILMDNGFIVVCETDGAVTMGNIKGETLTIPKEAKCR